MKIQSFLIMKTLAQKLTMRGLFTTCLLFWMFRLSAQGENSKFLENLFTDFTKDGFEGFYIIIGVFIVGAILLIVSRLFNSKPSNSSKIPKTVFRHRKSHRLK